MPEADVPARFLWRYRQFHVRLRRLHEQGVLLPGVITHADYLPGNDDYGYEVMLEYLFINPAGYEIHARIIGLLRDVRPLGLPRPGLIVSVLYAGDDCYVVL